MDLNHLSQDSASATLSLQAFWQLSPDLLGVLASTGCFTSLNEVWQERLGWTTAQLLGTAWIEQVHPRDRHLGSQVLSSLEVGKPQVWRGRYRQAQGNYCSIEWRFLKTEEQGVYLLGQPQEALEVTHKLELYERAIASIPSGVTIADCREPHYPLIYCNQAFETITGYKAAEILGQNCRFLQGVDTDPAALEQIRVCLREGINCHVTLKNYRKDGTSFWNELQLLPVCNHQGELTHCIGIQTDITSRQQAEVMLRKSNEALAMQVDARTTALRKLNQRLLTELVGRKRAEEAYRESEARLRAIFERATLGICHLDLAGRIRESNPMLQGLFGMSWEQLQDLEFLEFFHLDDRESCQELFADLSEGELNYFDRELRYRRSDHQMFWGHLKVSLVRNGEGKPQFVIAMLSDITERQQVESALKMTQFSLDRAAIAAFLVTPCGHLLYSNEAAALALGYRRSELLSLPIHELDPELPPEVWAEHWELLKEFGSLRLESQYRTKDGRLFPVEIVEKYLEFQGQEYSCLFALDISDRFDALSEARQALLHEQSRHSPTHPPDYSVWDWELEELEESEMSSC